MSEQGHDHEDHKHGLEFDLEALTHQRMHRRGALTLLGGGVALLSGAFPPAAMAAALCVADPQETGGPYPGDGSNSAPGATSNILTESGVVRSDIRASFGVSTNTAAGLPLTLRIKVGEANSDCTALPGYAIYLWHCTQDGKYSLYTLPEENYLRGVQVVDADGYVTFSTIFPGCYDGRWPHMHFEIYPSLDVASDHQNAVLTSQFAMPAATCRDVYASVAGYEASVSSFERISIDGDNVFGDNSSEQITMMTPTLTGNVTDGYTGEITVAIAA